MVITGNNRNSASPWPNPLLSLSLARSSLLHLHSPFSIQFFLSSLLFSSSSYLFFSSSSSLSLTPLSQSEESTTAQCASSYCHAVGQSREERGLIVFFSFSLHFLFPSRPPCPLLFRPLIKSSSVPTWLRLCHLHLLPCSHTAWQFPRLPPSRQPLPTIVPPISSCSLSLPPFRRSDTLGISFLYEWIVL